MNNFKRQVSSQFVQDTIPQSIMPSIEYKLSSQQVKIQQQEVEIARLKKLIATMEIRN